MRIEIIAEPTYTVDSADNNFNYSKLYFGDGGKDYPTSRHGIRIYQNEEIINDCIVIASGGATGIHKTSSLIDNENLIICCCDTVFCLSLPKLDLKWKVQADKATCFQIFKLEEDYIIHGELEITRLDKSGKIKWQFGGRDIFVSIQEGVDSFVVGNEYILLTDFSGTQYMLNFEGKELLDLT